MQKTKAARKKRASNTRANHPNLLNRITIDPKVLVGKPTIRGMRISVEQILNLLGEGMSVGEILREFPVLERDDIKAAIQYAHRVVADEKVYPMGSAA